MPTTVAHIPPSRNTGELLDIIHNLMSPTGIGIGVAISGNVLISLALNLQKLAHRRVELARIKNVEPQQDQPTRNGQASDRPISLGGVNREQVAVSADGNNQHRTCLTEEPEDVFASHSRAETQHLLPPMPHSRRSYSAGSANGARRHKSPKPALLQRLYSFPSRLFGKKSVQSNSEPDEAIRSLRRLGPTPDVLTNGQPVNSKIGKTGGNFVEEGHEGDYLRSKIWWLGFFLMNVGEVGNFISYGFAPASVVAPLGTFALIANCLFAPLIQDERFRKMDLLGVTIAIVGAVTVVLSSNTSDARLDPDALIQAISKRSFILFSCVYLAGAFLLATLSETSIGRNWVLVDIGICALFGGFTVLSTKAVSTLLTLEWFVMFTQWITYPILLTLIVTGVGQIRYLNRALMRFDSKVVIPTQFVLFTLSAIIGSAVLYGDFEKATVPQLLNFFYGCAATFLGVFIIAWVPSIEDRDSVRDVQEDSAETSSIRLGSEAGRNIIGDRTSQGTFGRKNRVRVLSHDDARDTISLQKRKSIVGMAVSPAQQLLLVHTPPHDIPDRWHYDDVERDPIATPDSHRRRAISWFGEDIRRTDTRDSSRAPTSPSGR